MGKRMRVESCSSLKTKGSTPKCWRFTYMYTVFSSPSSLFPVRAARLLTLDLQCCLLCGTLGFHCPGSGAPRACWDPLGCTELWSTIGSELWFSVFYWAVIQCVLWAVIQCVLLSCDLRGILLSCDPVCVVSCDPRGILWSCDPLWVWAVIQCALLSCEPLCSI